MTIDISGLAYALRTESALTLHPIKLSHAQQCVAAALGYRTLAAFQASDDEALLLDRENHILLDVKALTRRAAELELSESADELVALLGRAFSRKMPGIPVHSSRTEFEEALRGSFEGEVMRDDCVTGAMAMTNSDGIDVVHLPFDVEWDQVPPNGEPHAIAVNGHVAMAIDEERPYSGHRVDVAATLWLNHPGKAVWAAVYKVNGAQLYRGDESELDEMPLKVSLEEALAKTLGLSLADAEFLADAQALELASEDGFLFGWEFDFSDLDAPSRILRKIEKRYGSLQVRVSPDFFDQIHDREIGPMRHYVHGDQDERDASQYFCASCDRLVVAEHFEDEHTVKQGESRYLAALGRWRKRPARARVGLHRPPNAVNFFAIPERDSSKGQFFRWLEEQVGRDDLVGDLAQDVKRDKRFPRASSSKEELLDYFQRLGVQHVLKAFRQAWREFSGPKR